MLRGSYGSDNVINSRHTCEVYLTIRHVITQSGPHRCRGSVVIPVELRLRARTGSRVALARRGFVALPFRPHVALEAAAEPISRAAASISSSMQRATHISIRGRADRHANCCIGGSPTVPAGAQGGRRVARRRPRHRRARSARFAPHLSPSHAGADRPGPVGSSQLTICSAIASSRPDSA
jgi:hypothetical protein